MKIGIWMEIKIIKTICFYFQWQITEDSLLLAYKDIIEDRGIPSPISDKILPILKSLSLIFDLFGAFLWSLTT